MVEHHLIVCVELKLDFQFMPREREREMLCYKFDVDITMLSVGEWQRGSRPVI